MNMPYNEMRQVLVCNHQLKPYKSKEKKNKKNRTFILCYLFIASRWLKKHPPYIRVPRILCVWGERSRGEEEIELF